ncbi:hypothetical protein PanWU01x14_194130, partial [Parasponia andersonii]
AKYTMPRHCGINAVVPQCHLHSVTVLGHLFCGTRAPSPELLWHCNATIRNYNATFSTS